MHRHQRGGVMSKGNILTCPECGMTYKQVKDETEIYCNGKRTPASVGHKKDRGMIGVEQHTPSPIGFSIR